MSAPSSDGAYILTARSTGAATLICTISAVGTVATTVTATITFTAVSSSLATPQNLTVACTSSGTRLTVSFDAVADADSYLISGIATEPDERRGRGSGREKFTVGGTSRYRTYDVSVQSKTSDGGTSDPSPAVRVVCRRSAPSGLSATCGTDGTVTVEWDRYRFWDRTAAALFEWDGFDIDGDLGEYSRPTGGSPVVLADNSRAIRYVQPQSGRTYNIRLRAVHGATPTEWTSPHPVTCPLFIPASVRVECRRADERVHVSWDPVAGISSYTATIIGTKPPRRFERTKVLGPNFHSDPPTSFDFEGLVGWRYSVKVKAHKGEAASADSPAATATCTAVAPPAPTGVTASCSNDVLTVEWDPAGTGFSAATSYKPRVFTGTSMAPDTRWTTTTTATTATLRATGEDDLPETGIFKVKVKATNTAGDSDWSDHAEATCGPPGPVTGLVCAVVSDDSITIEWNPVVGDKGYQVVASILDVTSPFNASLLGWEDVGIPRKTSADKFVYEIEGLDSEVEYYLGVRARNDEGLGDLGSGSVRQCETIDDDWFVVTCSGDGALVAVWSDPSGDLPSPSGYTVTASVASSPLGSGVVGTYSGVGLTRSWLVSPNRAYRVEAMTGNMSGGPVYAKAERVKCPLLSSPDWNGPNTVGSDFWDRVLAAIETLGDSNQSVSPIEALLAPITIGVEQYYYTDYQIALASRACLTSTSDGHTTKTCDEVWDERIEVRLDESSLDQVVDDAIELLVPDDAFTVSWQSSVTANTLWNLHQTAQGTGYLGAVRASLPFALKRPGLFLAAAIIIDFSYHEVTQPRALISGMASCWFVPPEDRGSDIKSWKPMRHPTAGPPNSLPTKMTTTTTVGNVTTTRNSVIHYCQEEV